jgi:hypothetical protein
MIELENDTTLQGPRNPSIVKKSLLVTGELGAGFLTGLYGGPIFGDLGGLITYGFFPPFFILGGSMSSSLAVYSIGRWIGKGKSEFRYSFLGAMTAGISGFVIDGTLCAYENYWEHFIEAGVVLDLFLIPVGATIGYNIGRKTPLIMGEWTSALLPLLYPSILIGKSETKRDWKLHGSLFVFGESVLSSLAVYSIGRWIGKEDGSLKHSLLYATIAGLGSLGISKAYCSHYGYSEDIMEMTSALNLILIPVGATIGYNLGIH